MQHRLILAFLLFCFIGVSQTVPQRINYQGIVRSATGNPFVSKPINVKFQVLQGSPGGSVVFTEMQNLSTNNLGLFNTQIGNVNTTGLNAINWGANNYYLEISIDTTGNGNPVLVGTQQLVSVPYALYSAYSASAASAPAPAVSVSGTVLSVGSNTVGLPSSPVTPSTSIVTSGAISSTLVGNTYTLDAPLVTLSPSLTYGPASSQTVGGLAQVLGTYPNYTILVAPVIGYDPNSGVLSFTSAPFLQPTYNYTYEITPNLSISGSTLTLGPPSNSVVLPGGNVPTASLVSTGAAVTTTLGANSYSVNVPVPVITGSNAAAITGSYPSWTINVPNATTASLVSTGAAVTTTLGTNSYSVNVPIPVITGSNAAAVTGAYPNWTINVPNATAPTSITASGTGSPVVSTVGTNSFNISVPAVSLTTSGGGITAGGTFPNLTLSSPSVSLVHNGIGLAEVSGTYPNYIVTVAPNFTYMNTTGYMVITNTATGFSYSFNITPSLNFNPATGVLVSGPSSNSINVTPTLAYNAGTGVVTSGPASNSITIPTAVTPSMTGVGAAVVNPASGNSFTVSVPQTTVFSSNNTATVNSAGTNSFDISVPQRLNLTTAGATTLGGTYPNLNVGTPMVTVTGGTTIFGTPVPSGLLQIMGSYPNYSMIVSPVIAYNPTVGVLSLSSLPLTSPSYGYTYNITPNISISNNVITSGPTTNTIAITSPAAQAFAATGTALAITNAGSTLYSTTFNKQSATSEIDLFLHGQVNLSTFSVGGTQMVFELLVDGNVSTISTPHYLPDNTQSYITLRSVFSGLSTGSHTVSVRVRTLTGILVSCTLDPNNYGAKLILKETY